MERRAFVRTTCLACVSGTFAISLLQGCASANYFAKATMTSDQISILKSEFIAIIKEKSIERKFVLVNSDRFHYPICIYKLAENEYSALLMSCTHKGCELNPQPDLLVCPCHGSEFTNKGIVQSPPAEENLRTFSTSTDNETIYVHL